MENEKTELIEAINKIRVELGLQPYPLGYLEGKEVEELKKLFHQYFQLREEWKSKLKEEFKLRLNFKTILLTGVPLILLAVAAFFVFVRKTQMPALPTGIEEGKMAKPEISPEVNISQPSIGIYDLAIQSVFKDQANNYVVIIQNNGTEEITFQKMLIDEQNIAYKVLAGSYPPLKVGDVIYLQLQKQCDNSTHALKIISENKTLESELPAC